MVQLRRPGNARRRTVSLQTSFTGHELDRFSISLRIASQRIAEQRFLGFLAVVGRSRMEPQTDGQDTNKVSGVTGDFKPGRGSPVSIEDGKGNILKIDRDGEGNILTITSPHRAFIHLQHDLYNRITRASDSLGHAIQYSYDDYGRLAAVNDSAEGVTRYFYDSANNLAKVTRPDGRLWLAVEYDNRSRVTKMTFEDGSYNSYGYLTGAHGAIIAVKVISSNGSSRLVVVADIAGY
jgi:YD repeat-containing protein